MKPIVNARGRSRDSAHTGQNHYLGHVQFPPPAHCELVILVWHSRHQVGVPFTERSVTVDQRFRAPVSQYNKPLSMDSYIGVNVLSR